MKIRLASALLLFAACVPLFAGSFERFPLPRTVALNAYDIAGTDTYAWVLPYSSNLISKVGVDGSVETFVLPGFGIERIVLDPTDDSLWFASPQNVGHMALNGEITQYPLFANGYSVGDLIFGPDDSLWLTLDNQRVLRVTRSGDVTTVLPLDHSFYPSHLTNGPDGNIWISAHDSAKVGRLTPSGTLTQFPLPFSYDSPNGIVAAGDGNLWFTSNFSWLRKITPAGVMTDVSNNLGASGMIGLDGSNRLWWSHTFTNAPAVSVFDVATNTLSATFPLAADGKAIWALSAASNTVWWAGGKKFGRVYQGEMAEFSFNALGANPSAMASSSIDVWFAAPDENQVGRLDPTNGLTTLYTMPNADSRPLDIVAGTDAMWFTEETGNRIGRIDGNGAIQEFTIPTPNAKPTAITYGPDGNFWFTLAGADKIGRITPAGVITEFPLPGSGRYPNSLTFGPDGNLWFTSRDNNTIGKMTATGLVTEYPVTGDHPRSIVAAPDGTFVYSTDMHQYRMTPTGDVTLLAQFVAANDAIVGPDGALWSNQLNGVTRIGADGAVKTWTLPHGGWAGNAITIGPDGKVWVSESNTGALYRIIPDAPIAITPAAACRMPDGGVGGVLATFVDPDTTRSASDYNAYVGSSGGQVTQTGPGTFNVTGYFTGTNPVKVTVVAKPGTNWIGQSVAAKSVINEVSSTPSRTQFYKEGGSASLQIATDGSCLWNASTSSYFISLTGQTGSGAGTVSFTVAPNPNAFTRSGTISVNGQTVTITQQGYRNPQSQLYLVTPCRFIDTRDSTPLPAQTTWTRAVANQCGIPVEATAVVANVTIVNPAANGFVTLYPPDTAWPGTTTVSFRTGRTRANNVLIPIRYDAFNIYNGAATPVQFLIDVTGYFK